MKHTKMAGLSVTMVQKRDNEPMTSQDAAEALGDGTFDPPAGPTTVDVPPVARNPKPQSVDADRPAVPNAPPPVHPCRHGTTMYDDLPVSAIEPLYYVGELDVYDRDNSIDIVDLIRTANTDLFDEYEVFRLRAFRIEFMGTKNELRSRGLVNFAYVLDPYRDEAPGNEGTIDFRYEDSFLYKVGESTFWDVPVTQAWFYTVQQGDLRRTSPGRITLSSYPMRISNGVYEPTTKVPLTIHMLLDYKVTKFNYNAGLTYRYIEGGIHLGPSVNRNTGQLYRRYDNTIFVTWYDDDQTLIEGIAPVRSGAFVMQRSVPVTVSINEHGTDDGTDAETFEYFITGGNWAVDDNYDRINFTCDANFLQSWNIVFPESKNIGIDFSNNQMTETPFTIHYHEPSFSL